MKINMDTLKVTYILNLDKRLIVLIYYFTCTPYFKLKLLFCCICTVIFVGELTPPF